MSCVSDWTLLLPDIFFFKVVKRWLWVTKIAITSLKVSTWSWLLSTEVVLGGGVDETPISFELSSRKMESKTRKTREGHKIYEQQLLLNFKVITDVWTAAGLA